VDSFQCTGTFKEKTGKIGKAPQEFVGDGGKAQQSSGMAATAASAHSRQAVSAVTAVGNVGAAKAQLA